MVEATNTLRKKAGSSSASLGQLAYHAVRNAIEAGNLTPGDRVSEYKVAEWLSISRTPAREGLLRHHVVREGQPLNVLVYGMTRDQWDTNKQKLFDKFGTPQVISYEGPRVEPLPAPPRLVGAGVG